MSLYTLTIDLLLKTGAFEKDAGKSARQFEQRMQSMQASAKRAGTAIGLAISAGVAAGSAAVVNWSKQIADLGVEYDRLGSLAGTSSSIFQRWAAGAQSVGLANEKLADIFKDVQDKVGDYIQTGGGAMADFFDNIAKRTGVTAEQMRKLSGPDALGLYFSSLEKANLSQTEMTFYMEAIASDASALIPLLRNNAAGMKQWGDAADAAGAIIDGSTSKATERLRKISLEADLAFQGLKVSVAEGALPALADLSELMNSADFRDGFGSAVRAIAEVTAQIARLASTTAQVTGFVAQDLAARLNGPDAEDVVRVEERIGRLNKTIQAVQKSRGTMGLSLLNAQELIPSDLLSKNETVIKRLQAEVAKEQAKLEFGRQQQIEAAKAAAAAGQAVASGDVDRLAYRGTGNIGKAEREKAASEAKRLADEEKRQADSIARYHQQAEEAAGAMKGPLAGAMAKHLGNMSEYNSLLAEGNIAQADANVLMGQSAAEYAKVAAEVEAAIGGPEALIASMDGELAMLGKVGPARELYRRQLQNERDMRQELQRAVEAAGSKEALALAKGAGSYEEYERSMLAAADASATMSLRMEEAAANVDAWTGVVMQGVDSAADAFAEFVSHGLKDFDNLWDGLKDVAKQGLRDIARQLLQQKLVLPIQTQLMNGVSGSGGFSLQSLLGVLGGNGTAAGGQNLGGSASSSLPWGMLSPSPWSGPAVQTARSIPMQEFGNNMAAFTQTAGQGSWLSNVNWGGALSGGMLGMQGGDSLLTKGLSTAAGSFAGDALSGALSASMNAYKGGSSVIGAITGGLKSIGPAGWLGLGAVALDKITGGGLFGTSWKNTGGASQLNFGADGVSGVSQTTQSKKKSLFRGTKSRTTTTALDGEALSGAVDLFSQIEKAVGEAARGLGVNVTSLVAGSFRQEFDKNGELTKEFGQIAGQVYNEAQEAFAQRLAGENLLAVAKAYGASSEIEQLAQSYRGDAETLNEMAGLTLAVQTDIANAAQLWSAQGDGVISQVVRRMDELAQAGETMGEAYGRLTGAARNYGALMADVATQLVAGDLTAYQTQALDIERSYRQQVKAANDYAKALGLSGARAEDLAKIEALRATNMGKLQSQIDAEKKAMTYGLSVSELSPLTDQEKLQETMRELERAVSGGDSSAAQAAAQAALGFGRNLYASGKDYNALYGQVTGLIDGMKVGNLDLDDGTSMGALADTIEALPDNFSRAVFDLVVDNKAQTETTAAVQQSNALLSEQNNMIRDLLEVTAQGVRSSSSASLRSALNERTTALFLAR